MSSSTEDNILPSLEDGDAPDNHRTGAYKWYVLFVLVLIYILNQWDRNLLPYLSGVSIKECSDLCEDVSELFCEPCGTGDDQCVLCHDCLESHDDQRYNIQDATCVNGVEYGILTGVGFVFLYACFTLVAGRLADTTNRTKLLAVGLVVWSISSAGQSLAQNFGGLLLARVMLGIGESVGAPTSYSLISAYFEPEKRGVANGLYAISIYVGGGMGSLSLLFAQEIGWRATCTIVGTIGIGLAVMLWVTVREPPRGVIATAPQAIVDDRLLGTNQPGQASGGYRSPGLSATQRPGLISTDDADVGPLDPVLCDEPGKNEAPRDLSAPDDLTPLTSNPVGAPSVLSLSRSLEMIWAHNTVLLLYVASSLRFFGGSALGAWLAKYYQAAFPSKSSEYSVINAGVIAFGGAMSSFGGGYAADVVSRTRGAPGRALVVVVATTMSIPFVVGLLVVDSFYWSMTLLFFEYVFAENWFGPIMSILQSELPPGTVGIGTALFAFCSMLVGSASPPIIGVFYDRASDKASVRWPLMVCVVSSYVLSTIVFFVVQRRLSSRRALGSAGLLGSGPPSGSYTLASPSSSSMLRDGPGYISSRGGEHGVELEAGRSAASKRSADDSNLASPASPPTMNGGKQ